MRSNVRSGAIRIDITNPEEWSAGDIAVLQNQEAKRVRDIGSLIFETPIQHDYEAGVEARSLLSTEQLEEIDDRLAVTDVDPQGTRYVRFWVDEIPIDDRVPSDERQSQVPTASRDVNRAPVAPERRGKRSPTQETVERDHSRRSPDFGGGTGCCENDSHQRGHIPEGGSFSQQREHISENERRVPPRLSNAPKTPPEDQVPRGCSLTFHGATTRMVLQGSRHDLCSRIRGYALST